MPNDPEKELQEFLASKPEWVQMALQSGNSQMTPQQRLWWMDESDELIEQYEQILRRIPRKWKQYRQRTVREFGTILGSILVSKGKPGRKKNVKLAERIWSLDAEGKSNREIQQMLNASGENLSLDAVESYLKNRRRRLTE